MDGKGKWPALHAHSSPVKRLDRNLSASQRPASHRQAQTCGATTVPHHGKPAPSHTTTRAFKQGVPRPPAPPLSLTHDDKMPCHTVPRTASVADSSMLDVDRPLDDVGTWKVRRDTPPAAVAAERQSLRQRVAAAAAAVARDQRRVRRGLRWMLFPPSS
jgi:hypothetical protein